VGEIFSAPVQTGPAAHPASCTMGTGFFSGVKSGRGVTVSPHPLLVPSRKSRPNPLLPLWVKRPVQNLSACTRVQYTFFFNPYQKGGNTCTKTCCHLHRAFYGIKAYTHFMVVDTNVSIIYRTELPPTFPSVSTC